MFTKKLREEHYNIFNELDDNLLDLSSEIGPSFFKQDSWSLNYSKIDHLKFLNDIGMTGFSKLSKREMDVAKQMIQGYSANEIALQLSLSKRTVESYIENLKTKLACYSKAELIQKCLDLALNFF